MISNTYVPNIGPDNARIALVGEAPGQDEEEHLNEHGAYSPEPFVGKAGEKLTTCLGRNGISRDEAFLGNLCNHRPQDNKFFNLLNSPQLKEGIENLSRDLQRLNPNVVVALGAWPLWFLTGKAGFSHNKLTPGTGITNWRGSILQCTIPGIEHLKVIPTFHPSFVLRNAKAYPMFDLDIKRVKGDSEFPELRLPEHKYIINPTTEELQYYTDLIIDGIGHTSADVETFGRTLACVGFSVGGDTAICIPWSSGEFARSCIKKILGSGIPITFHFGTFDYNYLEVLHDVQVANWEWCTFIAQRVMEPELPRTLAYLTSIITRMPYYKQEGKEVLTSDTKSWNPKTINLDQLWAYNCKDCVATELVKESQAKEMDYYPEWSPIFKFDMAQARESASIVSRAGMLVDAKRLNTLKVALYKSWANQQQALNTAAGVLLNKKPKEIGTSGVYEFVNAGSPKQCKELLYGVLGFRQRRTREGKTTTDENAIIGCLMEAKKEYESKSRADARNRWLRKLLCCKLILIIRGVRKKLSSYIEIEISSDGRARGLYKLATETGRWACEKWVDGTGLNMQTIPRDEVECQE